jgi:alkylhydroperoxidase family enzyme
VLNGCGVMTDISRQRKMLIERVLSEAGTASQKERKAAFENENIGLTQPIATLIQKVATHAASVTDRDVAAARASGLSEDQIFELITCAAIGQSTRQI